MSTSRPTWCDIVADCAARPRTSAEIVDAYGPKSRATVYNLVRSGRLVNIGDKHGGIFAASAAAKAIEDAALNGRTRAPKAVHASAADRFTPIALELAWMGRALP